MDRRGLAQELRRWAVEEMGLPQQKAPTEEMLHRLFIGQCADIWKYIIRHVRSQRTVKNMEGNLLWYQQLQRSEAQLSAEEEEQQRRKRLCQEILDLRSELQHLQEQIQSAEQEVVGQDLNGHKSQDFRRRSLLLGAYNTKREEECEALRGSNLRIQYRCDQLQEVSRASQREVVFPALDAGSAMDTFPEPEVLRDVRNVCQMRFKFLRSLHDDTVSGSLLSGGEDLRSLAHQQWMSMAEKVWSSHPPGHVLASLEHLALETTREMRQLQSSLAPDPTETSCSVSDTTSDPPETRDHAEAFARLLGALPSFSSLIQEGWAESVKVTSQLRSVQCQSQELSACLAERIQEMHRALSGSGELCALSRAAYDAELRSVLLRGCQDALLHECRTLQAEAADRKQEVKILLQQQQNIEDSCLILDKKQKQIQVLIKGNSASKSQIRRSGMEVQKYVEEKLIPRPQELVHESQRLHDSVMKDVRHFSAITLPALQKVSADGVNLLPAQELSINRLSDPNSPYYNIYRGIYSSVSLSLYKAPETVLPHVAEMKKRLLFLRSQLCSHNHVITRIQRQLRETQSPDIDTLLQLLCAHYSQQTDRLLPALQRLIQQSEQSQEYGKKVQASVSDWWEQPAQLCLPWEQRGGHTLRQWRDRWTVAVTALQRASDVRS
ncbi:HAUS augmin-like complex subunit 5 [Dendropsophus ebraccatus]|uniref:HAUS augmin-like complex subunit 5 n=1 Tax=Dendropsophus ebraccatus TaxID=150705 RepID=UPI00383116F9